MPWMIPTLFFGFVDTLRSGARSETVLRVYEGCCGPRALFMLDESCASVYSSEGAHVSNSYFHTAIVIGTFDVLVV